MAFHALRFVKYRISVRLLFLLFLTAPLFSVTLSEMKNGSLLLGPYMRIFEDKAGTPQWADVLAGKHEADFKAQNKAVPNFGSTRSVIWAVVTLTPQSPLPEGEGKFGLPSPSGRRAGDEGRD